MAESVLAGKSERLVSLDVFRGITIAGMVLVNNPGTWSKMYWPLGHAQWDGLSPSQLPHTLITETASGPIHQAFLFLEALLKYIFVVTPTDFVFPFFLFIVGVAMTFSFDRRLREGESRVRIFEQVVRRSVILVILSFSFSAVWAPKWGNLIAYILILVGLALVYMDEPIFGGGKNPRERVHKGLGWMCLVFGLLFFLGSLGQFGTQRVPGVLQRIAAAYFFASIIMFYTGWRGRLIWVIGLITGYYLIMKFVHAPEAFTLPPKEGWVRDAPAGAPFPGGLNAWIDWKIFGANQYSHQPDPEGLFSTIPSIATVLLGTLTGTWLKTKNDTKRKALILFGVGVGCIVLGYLMGFIFPVNKKIWSSSYVVFAGGWATAVLGLCMLLIDVAGFKKWAFPFVILGTNAILVYYLSTMMAIGLGKFGIKTWIYSNVIQKLYSSPELQSLTWALLYVILWVFLTYPLYRKRIFLKI